MKHINKLTILSILFCFVFLLSGCGQTLDKYIADNYTLIDAQGDTSSGLQKVYRAKSMSISQVVDKISSQQAPKEKSEVIDDKAVLVYSDNIITVKRDDNNDQDSLIYLSSYQFVQNNTDSGFWKGYLTATILNNLFDIHRKQAPPYPSTDSSKYRAPWDYQGSSAGDIKKPDNSIKKPSTLNGLGSVIRKSPDSSKEKSSYNSNSYNSSKGTGSVISKPRTSTGSGSVIRRSRR